MSVIPLLKDRTDVDPAIWLIQLSRDPEEMVRLGAVEAMAALKSAAVQRRLTEMARSDVSEAVRKAAGKLATPVRENTASLPPLPGLGQPEPQGQLNSGRSQCRVRSQPLRNPGATGSRMPVARACRSVDMDGIQIEDDLF